ncbi:MAG: RNA polymerase sigma factor [Candidatus Eisenbacteria sp.]|nr:RNA polymerase sigma factor [Candidatus Eisenbacteria bacterium]
MHEPDKTKAIAELLALARSGDLDAENLLFERLHARVSALAKRRIMDAEAAQDIAQDTIKTAYERYRTAEMPRGLLPWLFMILRNKVGNYLKRRSVEGTRLVRGNGSGIWSRVGTSPAAGIAAFDLERALGSALRRASPECRKIFRLLLAGAQRKEIRAAFDGEPMGTIDSRISRCRQKLLLSLGS